MVVKLVVVEIGSGGRWWWWQCGGGIGGGGSGRCGGSGVLTGR